MKSQEQQTAIDGRLCGCDAVDLQSSSRHHNVLKAMFDTGAQGNILPIRIYHQTYPHTLEADGILDWSHKILTLQAGDTQLHSTEGNSPWYTMQLRNMQT